MERTEIGIRDTGDRRPGRRPVPRTRTTSPTHMRRRPRRPRRRAATSGDALPWRIAINDKSADLSKSNRRKERAYRYFIFSVILIIFTSVVNEAELATVIYIKTNLSPSLPHPPVSRGDSSPSNFKRFPKFDRTTRPRTNRCCTNFKSKRISFYTIHQKSVMTPFEPAFLSCSIMTYHEI